MSLYKFQYITELNTSETIQVISCI